jgi:hypothetical protein
MTRKLKRQNKKRIIKRGGGIENISYTLDSIHHFEEGDNGVPVAKDTPNSLRALIFQKLTKRLPKDLKLPTDTYQYNVVYGGGFVPVNDNIKNYIEKNILSRMDKQIRDGFLQNYNKNSREIIIKELNEYIKQTGFSISYPHVWFTVDKTNTDVTERNNNISLPVATKMKQMMYSWKTDEDALNFVVDVLKYRSEHPIPQEILNLFIPNYQPSQPIVNAAPVPPPSNPEPGFFNDYLVNPVGNVASGIGSVTSDYVINPVSNIFTRKNNNNNSQGGKKIKRRITKRRKHIK